MNTLVAGIKWKKIEQNNYSINGLLRYYDGIVCDNQRNYIFRINAHAGLLYFNCNELKWRVINIPNKWNWNNIYSIKSMSIDSFICEGAISILPALIQDKVCMDCQRNRILINDNGKLIILQIEMNNTIKSANIEIIPNTPRVRYETSSCASIVNGDILHLIQLKHIKYNLNNNKMSTILSFKDLNDKLYHVRNQEIIKLKDTSIIMMGGEISTEFVDLIYKFDINKNEWTQINCRIPTQLCGFGTAVIQSGTYIALFGGSTRPCTVSETDNIYLYSINEQKMYLSKKKCPDVGEYTAMCIKLDKEHCESIMMGFTRRVWKTDAMDSLFPPYYLIQLMQKYLVFEFIHLFRKGTMDHHIIDACNLMDFF